jgi:site-specific DNA-methyltransferase (adenine-specific)
MDNQRDTTEYKNKVIQGDCLQVMKGIPDKSVDCIITDPPYGMKYQSAMRTATPQFKKIENDNNIDWFPEFIKECYRVLKDNSHIYIFCNDYNISKFRDLQEQAGFKNKRTLVWVKNNHTSGDLLGDYANKTEFINYAQKGRRLLNGGRDTNVLNFSRVSKLEHPTQKPVDLNEYLIKKSTNENDIILDPFAGSGTTGVACKNLNRNYILIEKEPEYIDIINKRLNL